jgi:hypothetical protein
MFLLEESQRRASAAARDQIQAEGKKLLEKHAFAPSAARPIAARTTWFFHFLRSKETQPSLALIPLMPTTDIPIFVPHMSSRSIEVLAGPDRVT